MSLRFKRPEAEQIGPDEHGVIIVRVDPEAVRGFRSANAWLGGLSLIVAGVLFLVFVWQVELEASWRFAILMVVVAAVILLERLGWAGPIAVLRIDHNAIEKAFPGGPVVRGEWSKLAQANPLDGTLSFADGTTISFDLKCGVEVDWQTTREIARCSGPGSFLALAMSDRDQLFRGRTDRNHMYLLLIASFAILITAYIGWLVIYALYGVTAEFDLGVPYSLLGLACLASWGYAYYFSRQTLSFPYRELERRTKAGRYGPPGPACISDPESRRDRSA